jgi:hypothetical protein
VQNAPSSSSGIPVVVFAGDKLTPSQRNAPACTLSVALPLLLTPVNTIASTNCWCAATDSVIFSMLEALVHVSNTVPFTVKFVPPDTFTNKERAAMTTLLEMSPSNVSSNAFWAKMNRAARCGVKRDTEERQVRATTNHNR